MSKDRVRINHQIRASELRVIGADGVNIGVTTLREALEKANAVGLDLIEISPNANPPVAKIMDYGKYQYDENKKQKATKAKTHVIEVKSLQIRIGTGEHDLDLKAKKVGEWLKEGHRIKIELFLPGRSKYMDPKFLEERLKRQKSPKGLSTIIEKA